MSVGDICPPLPLCLFLAIPPSTCRGGGILVYFVEVIQDNQPFTISIRIIGNGPHVGPTKFTPHSAALESGPFTNTTGAQWSVLYCTARCTFGRVSPAPSKRYRRGCAGSRWATPSCNSSVIRSKASAFQPLQNTTCSQTSEQDSSSPL